MRDIEALKNQKSDTSTNVLIVEAGLAHVDARKDLFGGG